MPESEGQKKLRLTKERLTNELRLRTMRRQAQLREEAIDRLKKRAKEEGRKDDASFETINKRFDEYLEKTLPLIELYTKNRKVKRIDSSEGKDAVLSNVVDALGLKKSKEQNKG